MSEDPQQPADGDAEPVTGPEPTADVSAADADEAPVADAPTVEGGASAAGPDAGADAPDADAGDPVAASDADADALDTGAADPAAAPDADADVPGAEAGDTAGAPDADADASDAGADDIAAASDADAPDVDAEVDADTAAAAEDASDPAGGTATGSRSAPSHPPTRRSHRPRAVDFSQPTKFTSEQQRRIARGLEGFCQTASTRLSSELRTPLELEVGPASQIAWLMAQRQLPASSLAVTLEVEPLGTRMLLAADLRLVLVAVECLLGGAPERAPEERRLSEIDWALIRRLFDTIVAQLSAAWQDLARLSLRAGDIELQAEAVQIASVSEPTLVFKLLARIGEHPGNMSLLIPWQAIDPVAAAIGGHGALAEVEDAGAVMAIEHALSGAKVTMRAEVAAAEMGIEEVLALREGSLVTLGGRVEQGISLVVEDRVIARAAPGRRGQRRAVQIVSDGDRR